MQAETRCAPLSSQQRTGSVDACFRRRYAIEFSTNLVNKLSQDNPLRWSPMWSFDRISNQTKNIKSKPATQTPAPAEDEKSLERRRRPPRPRGRVIRPSKGGKTKSRRKPKGKRAPRPKKGSQFLWRSLGQALHASSVPVTLNDGMGDSEIGVTLLDPYEASKNYLRTIADPIRSSHAVLPDRYTTFPTASYRYQYYVNPTIYRGTVSNDGAALFLIRGDPFYTYTTGTVNTDGTYGWSANTSLNGSLTTYHRSRCVAVGIALSYTAVGDPHNVRYSLTRTGPAAFATQAAAGATFLPANVNLGVTGTQATQCLGRDSILTPERNTVMLTLATLSGTAACAFMNPTTDRSDDGGEAVCLWLYGMRNSDMLTVRVVMHYQYYPIYTGVWLDPSAVVVTGSNSIASDVSQSLALSTQAAGDDLKQDSPAKLQNAAERQTEATNSIVETAKSGDFVDNLLEKGSRILGGIGQALWGVKPMSVALRRCCNIPPDHVVHTAAGRIINSNITNAVLTSSFATSSSPSCPEEEKLEDQPVMLTPKSARRPSLVPSLTSRKR